MSDLNIKVKLIIIKILNGYRYTGFICPFEKVSTKWRQILKDLSFPRECGTILPGQTFHLWEKEGKGSELSWREFWVIRNSPQVSLLLIPFRRLMPLFIQGCLTFFNESFCEGRYRKYVWGQTQCRSSAEGWLNNGTER